MRLIVLALLELRGSNISFALSPVHPDSPSGMTKRHAWIMGFIILISIRERIDLPALVYHAPL